MTEEQRIWVSNALAFGGTFIQSFARACFYADPDNFVILKDALDIIRKKYPKYSKQQSIKNG